MSDDLHQTSSGKRLDVISWDEFFMSVAIAAQRRSKDPNTQVGACIVSQDNIIISTGYNGMPKGCSDDEYPWERDGDQTKYPYVVHAELNAVLNANGRDLRGSKLYVALFPCAFLVLLMLSFNLFGNGLRDALNPSLRGSEG